jgi:hypothetical protein
MSGTGLLGTTINWGYFRILKCADYVPYTQKGLDLKGGLNQGLFCRGGKSLERGEFVLFGGTNLGSFIPPSSPT